MRRMRSVLAAALWATAVLATAVTAAGVLVTLSDTLAQATMPATVTIPAGEATSTFVITTTPVSSPRTGSVSATLSGRTVAQPLTLRPIGLASLRLDPLSVVGSRPVTGQAQLECPAGPGPITVNLESSDPALANPVSPYLVIPPGVQSERFDVTTNLVPRNTTVQIVGTANGTRRSRGLTVEQPLAVTPASLKFGTQIVGTWSPVLSMTVSNKAAETVAVGNGVAVDDSYGRDYTWDWALDSCSPTPYYLPPGASCTVGVRLKPKTAGKISGYYLFWLDYQIHGWLVDVRVPFSARGVLPR